MESEEEGEEEEEEEEEEEAGARGGKRKRAEAAAPAAADGCDDDAEPRPVHAWCPWGWVSRAARAGGQTGATSPSGYEVAERPALRQLKDDMLLLASSVPLTAVQRRSVEGLDEWAEAVGEAETVQQLSDHLMDYVRMMPRAAFKKGFKPWWPTIDVDGGASGISLTPKPKSEVPRDPDAPRMTGKEAMASGLDPGEIVDCAHQVLLRLYMLDAGLNYR